MEENKKLNIYQKLLAITTELEPVAKALNVSIGKGSYKAVSEYSVLEAVKPLENKYGIYSYPHHREIVNQAILEGYDGKKSVFVRIETTYRFINVDNPSEFIDVISYGDGVDTQDKATGKAMTYADKYALMKAYKVQTGDDPDAKGSEEIKVLKPAYDYEMEIVSSGTASEFNKIVEDMSKDLALTQAKKMEFWKLLKGKAEYQGLTYDPATRKFKEKE